MCVYVCMCISYIERLSSILYPFHKTAIDGGVCSGEGMENGGKGIGKHRVMQRFVDHCR